MWNAKQVLTWSLIKQKKRICGMDNFVVSVNGGEMKVSCFEILESLPREYVRQFLNYLDKSETWVDPKGRYSEEK